MPEPIIPNATRNQGEALSPSKKLLSLVCLEANHEIIISRAKYARIINRISDELKGAG
jgi:hypothetical protein